MYMDYHCHCVPFLYYIFSSQVMWIVAIQNRFDRVMHDKLKFPLYYYFVIYMTRKKGTGWFLTITNWMSSFFSKRFLLYCPYPKGRNYFCLISGISLWEYYVFTLIQCFTKIRRKYKNHSFLTRTWSLIHLKLSLVSAWNFVS